MSRSFVIIWVCAIGQGVIRASSGWGDGGDEIDRSKVEGVERVRRVDIGADRGSVGIGGGEGIGGVGGGGGVLIEVEGVFEVENLAEKLWIEWKR